MGSFRAARIAWIAAVGAAAGGVWPAEEPKPSPPAAADTARPDPIEAAKAQLEEVRSMRRGVPSDAPARLDVATPPAPATEQPLPRPTNPATLESARPEQRNSWLLDAMRNTDKREKPAERNRRPGDAPTETSSVGRFRRDANPAEQGSGARDDKTRNAAATAAVNPLDNYLSAWMSPADYALLVKPLKEARGAAADFASGMPATGAPPRANASVAGLPAPDMALWTVAPPPSASAVPPDNPYLKALQSSTFAGSAQSATVGPAALLVPAAARPLAPGAPTTAPADLSAPAKPANNSAVPDRFKPSDDRKYFPQLKRF